MKSFSYLCIRELRFALDSIHPPHHKKNFAN